MVSRIHAAVVDEPLSHDALVAFASDASAGAIVTFTGVTREVDRLDYEAYTEMAGEQMQRIAAAVADAHGVCAAAVEHRIGAVARSEPSVIVAVSAPHRAEAFAAARELIDRVKAEVPIWKREIAGSSAAWVAGALPGDATAA
jgi:molybdopterin synthase catalytic subunit